MSRPDLLLVNEIDQAGVPGYDEADGEGHNARRFRIAKGDRNGYVVEASYFARRNVRDEQIRGA